MLRFWNNLGRRPHGAFKRLRSIHRAGASTSISLATPAGCLVRTALRRVRACMTGLPVSGGTWTFSSLKPGWLHAEVPRVACSVCGKTSQIDVPWAREGMYQRVMHPARMRLYPNGPIPERWADGPYSSVRLPREVLLKFLYRLPIDACCPAIGFDPFVRFPNRTLGNRKRLWLTHGLILISQLTDKSTPTTDPLRSTPITGASSLLRGHLPLCPASVLRRSQCLCFAPLPSHRDDRFPRSVQGERLAVPS